MRDVGVRDLDRIREKMIFRMDPSHVVLACLGLLILLALSFLAGLWIGRGSGATEPRTASPDALIPPVRAGTLRPPAPEADRAFSDAPKPATSSRVTLAVRPPEARLSDSGIATISRRDLAAVPITADPGPWPSTAMTRVACQASCGNPDGDCIVVPPPLPPQALARPEEGADRLPEHPAEPLPARWVAPDPGAAAFTVQVRSYRDEVLAGKFVDELAAKGVTARIVTRGEGSEAWHRVWTGRFRSLSEAHEFASKLNRETGEQAIAVPAGR
jgi:hypothetical protein